MNDVKKTLNDINFKHNIELNRTISDYRTKILEEKKEHEKKISSINSEFHQKTKALELTVDDQRKTIFNLLSQMTKLSNDAVVAISNLKRRKVITTTRLQVIDQTCKVCNGRGKNKEKTPCPTCDGKGLNTTRGTRLRRYWRDGCWHETYDCKKHCELCGGKGYLIKFRTCSPCNGVGRVPLKNRNGE